MARARASTRRARLTGDRATRADGLDSLKELIERLDHEQHILEVIDLEWLIEDRFEVEGSSVAAITQRIRGIAM